MERETYVLLVTTHMSRVTNDQTLLYFINIKRFHIIRLECPHHKEKVGFSYLKKDNLHRLVSLKPKLLLKFLNRNKHMSNVIVFRLRLIYEKRDLASHSFPNKAKL